MWGHTLTNYNSPCDKLWPKIMLKLVSLAFLTIPQYMYCCFGFNSTLLENYIIRNTSLGKGLHRDWEFSWHAYVKIFLGSELPNCLPQLLSTFNSLSLILHSSFIFYVVRATCCEELMKMPFVVPVLISLSACCCLLRSLLLINSTSIMW